MAKDPAFLFYSQDFYTGVATLNWEERGKFISILCLMHQKGRMSEETIRFLVGSVSDNLKTKFSIDAKGLWFNQRLEDETTKRNKFTESRRNNGFLGGRPKKEKPTGKPKQKLKVTHTPNRMENANEIEDEVLNEYKKWTEQILDSNDHEFDSLLFNERWDLTVDRFEYCVKDHLDLLHRYPNMRPAGQQSFRQSVIKHIRENKDKKNGKQGNNKQQHTDSIKDTIRNTYGYTDKP